MKTSCRDIFVVTLLCSASFLQPGLGREVAVKSGTLQDSAGLGPASVPSFFMSQFRTTRDEWKSNPLGLYDMSGYNSYGKRGEWCWDFGEPQYSTKRIWRANWWDAIAVGWSSSYPIYKYPDPRGHGLGFRTVRKSRCK